MNDDPNVRVTITLTYDINIDDQWDALQNARAIRSQLIKTMSDNDLECPDDITLTLTDLNN